MIDPILTVSYVGGKIIVTDETIYGGANPEREDYLIEFTVIYKGASHTEKTVALNDYDPATVSEVFGTVGDGRYYITMEITGAEEITFTQDVLIYDNLAACVEDKKDAFINSTCCEGDPSGTYEEYSKVALMLELIQEIDDSGKGYNKAQCLLEYAFTFCKTSNCICGC